MKNKTLTIIAITLLTFVAGKAQIATGGTYKLEQSVIASGGGQNSTGGNYSLDGTIGQAVADTTGATATPYRIQSGFWTPSPVAPTAASVTISGRVLIDNFRGLRNALVVITDGRGAKRVAATSAFGYFNFTDISAGEVYVLSVQSKRYTFVPQVLFAAEDLSEVIFNAVGQNSSGLKIE